MFPLTLYLKIAAAIVVVCLLGYVYYALNDRTVLQAKFAAQSIQIQQYQDAMARDAKMREWINDAIGKIRVSSNNYITTVDSGKPFNVPDGTVVQLVPAGSVSKATRMPTFSAATSSRGPSDNEAR